MRSAPVHGDARPMTPYAPSEPETGFDRRVFLAVVSPMLAGLVWAVLTYVSWRNEAVQSGDALVSLITYWALLGLGCFGFIVLSVPLVIGLAARSRTTRVAAAWVS